MARILVLEDEKTVNDLVARNLALAGHTAVQAYSGTEAIAIAQNTAFDLLVIDVILPDMDGFRVGELLRGIPKIFVSESGETADKLKGFAFGAEDYVVKPFEPAELLLRIEAILRRTCRNERRFAIDDLEVDFDAKTVRKNGVSIDLTLQEYALLEALVKNRNVALSRERLMREAWDVSFMGETRTVDVHIQRLRKKLGLEQRIKTVYRLGYRLETAP